MKNQIIINNFFLNFLPIMKIYTIQKKPMIKIIYSWSFPSKMRKNSIDLEKIKNL
ncbi:MAG: hypothetical protein ACJAVE_000982 [Polaribacter sp.]|jgi:hypothetical protein